MSEIIEAQPIKAPETVTVYVLMVRYGDATWHAQSTHLTPDDASSTATSFYGGNTWRIVAVHGLPVHVADGQV